MNMNINPKPKDREERAREYVPEHFVRRALTGNIEPNSMTHEEAVRNQVAEHFALGELAQEDRERFEAHFFDCDECFESASVASEFLHHAHKVLPPEEEKNAVARFLTELWRPTTRVMATLCLGLVGFGIYQQTGISNLKRPTQVWHTDLMPQTRSPGNEKEISVPRGTRLVLEAGFLQRDEFKSYRSLILSEPDKQVKYVVPLHLEEGAVSAMIVLPPEILNEGTYSMLIQGQHKDGQWIAIQEDKQEAGGVFHIRAHGL
jgi:hypothetical protein